MSLGKNFGKRNNRKRRFPKDDSVKVRDSVTEAVPAKRITKMHPKENTSKNKPFQEIKNTHIRFDDKTVNESAKNIEKIIKGPADSKVGKSSDLSKKHVSPSPDKSSKQAKVSSSKTVPPKIHDENVCNTSSKTATQPQEVKKKNNKPKKTINIVADITHKKSTGDSNWSRFLKEKNIEIKTPDVSPKSSNNNTNNKNLNLNNKRNEINNKIKAHPAPKLTKVVGLDCEMVGVGENGKEHMLARVSIVNNKGDCLYDKFVKPKEDVVDYRTYVSGVRPEDIANGEDFETVQKDVAGILKNRILVGHSLKNDLAVLHLSHPKWAIRDTSKYFREQGKGTPGLKKLALEYLDVTIQEGEHSSVQDAQAAVQLYNLYRKPWESGGGNKKSNRINKQTPKPIMMKCT